MSFGFTPSAPGCYEIFRYNDWSYSCYNRAWHNGEGWIGAVYVAAP